MGDAGVVLEEEIDENYEPSHEDILEYAQWLGMEIPEENDLLWIAREGLKAPLPDHWKPCRTELNEIYYFNFSTGESVWDHPCDEHFRTLYTEEKARLRATSPRDQQASQSKQQWDSRSSLPRQISLPPQPGNTSPQKPLKRHVSLQQMHLSKQRSSEQQEKRRKSDGEQNGQPTLPAPQARSEETSNPDSPDVQRTSGKVRGEWTDSETDEMGPLRSAYARNHSTLYQNSESGKERIKLVSNSLRRSESGNPLGTILAAPSHYDKVTYREREVIVRQQQEQQQFQSLRGMENLAQQEAEQRQHLEEKESEAGGHLEDGRRQMALERQRKEQEDLEMGTQGRQVVRGGEWRRDSEEGATSWMVGETDRLDDRAAMVQEEARLQEVAVASQRRLAKYEAECDVRLAKLQNEREQLVRRRENEITKLAERLGQPLEPGALVNARNIVAEEGRALIAQEREIAVATAREEGEREKQRVMARIQEELGAQLALERQRMAIDPRFFAEDSASAAQNRSTAEARVRQWKAIIEQEQAAGSQAGSHGSLEAEQIARVKAAVVEDEVRMLEHARREVAQRVEKTVELEERRELDALMRQMRERIRMRIVEEERKALQQERLEMLDRVGEAVAEEEEVQLDQKRKDLAERVDKEVEEEASILKQEKLAEAQKRLEDEVIQREDEERMAMFERVKRRVRDLERETLENERAKVVDWVRKRIENEGRDFAVQQRAKVRLRVEEEELRITEALMAEMEDRVKEKIANEEGQLLATAREMIREGRNGEQKLTLSDSILLKMMEGEQRAKLEELRKQMEMRVADQIASEEADLVVQKRKEMQVRVDALSQEEDRRGMALQRRGSSRWSSDVMPNGLGKAEGVIWSMEKTQADAFREVQVRVAGEKQTLEVALREHLASARKEIEERERREIEHMRNEMMARVEKAVMEEEKTQMENKRIEIRERLTQNIDEQELAVSEEMKMELRLKLEKEIRAEIDSKLKEELSKRVQMAIEEENLRRSAGGVRMDASEKGDKEVQETEIGRSRESMLRALHAEIEEERKRRLREMEENLGKELAQAREEKMLEITRKLEEEVRERTQEDLDKSLEAERAALWDEKMAKLDAEVEEEIGNERAARYNKARRVMEMNLRHQIASEREEELRRLRAEKVGQSDSIVERLAAISEQEGLQEGEGEVIVYQTQLLGRSELSEQKSRKEKLTDVAQKHPLPLIEFERRNQAESIQLELQSGLEEFRAQVTRQFEADCARIRREAERALERVEEEMEDRMEQKVERMKAETKERLERIRREMEADLNKQLEEERAGRLTKLAEELEREEMQMTRDWQAAMDMDEGDMELLQYGGTDRSRTNHELWGDRKPTAVRDAGIRNGTVAHRSGEGRWVGVNEREIKGVSHGRSIDDLEHLPGSTRMQTELLPSLERLESERGDLNHRFLGEGRYNRGKTNTEKVSMAKSPVSSPSDSPQTLKNLRSPSSEEPSPSGRKEAASRVSANTHDEVKGDTHSSSRQDSFKSHGSGKLLEPITERDGEEDPSQEAQAAGVLTLSSPHHVDENREVDGGNKKRDEEKDVSVWRMGGGEVAEGEDTNKPSPEASASNFESTRESSFSRGKTLESDKGQRHKGSEGGWSTRGSHRRSRHRWRTADESDDYYSAWTDTATEVSSVSQKVDDDRKAFARENEEKGAASLNKNGPSLGLSLTERAKLFVAEQQRHLQERRAMIEQARADWRGRMQALDHLSDEEERRRKASYLMEVKSMLEQHAKQLREDVLHIKTLHYALPHSEENRFEAHFNSRNMERLDTDKSRHSHSLFRMDTDQSRGYGRMDTDQSRQLSRMNTDQSRPVSPPRFWDRSALHTRSSGVSQPGSPLSATNLALSHGDTWRRTDLHKQGEKGMDRRARVRSLGDEYSWMNEFHVKMRMDSAEGSFRSGRKSVGEEGRVSWRGAGRHTDDESLRDRMATLLEGRRRSDLETFSPLQRRQDQPQEYGDYPNGIYEQRHMGRSIVKQQSYWLARFHDQMMGAGRVEISRSSTPSAASSAGPLK